MKRILPIMLGLICLAFATSAQTIFYVNKATGSDANTGASWSASFQNLTKALSAANASTATEVQIWIAGGVYNPIEGITPAPVIVSDTSFAFYRGNGVARALKVYGGFAGTETNITDRDAVHPTYLDGAIGTDNSYHVAVIANLPSAADSIVLDGLTIRNGLATNTGATIYNGLYVQESYGGGLVMLSVATPRVAVRNCVFDNNKAVSLVANGCGGAVYMHNSLAVFESCTFSNNFLSKDLTGPSGNLYGGALFAVNGIIKLTGCAFNNNLSLGNGPNTIINSGGAVYLANSDSATYIEHCNFTGNIVRNKYSGYAYGGGIANFHTFIRAVDCSFTGNQASDSAAIVPALACAGGAVYDNFSANSVYDSCTFAYNKASNGSGYGGAIYDSIYCTTWISNSTISNSTAGADGGALYANEGFMFALNCNINNNSAARGGAFFSKGPSTAGAAFSNIHNNTAALGGAVFNEASVFIIGNDSVHDNTAGNSGGGIYSDSGYIILQASNVWNNSVPTGSGGGIYVRVGKCDMDTCTFGGNTAVNGGAIMLGESVRLSITRSILNGNKATGNGGGISIAGSLAVPTAEIFNCRRNIFINNKAATGGGAIFINSLAAVGTADTIINNLFLGNSTTSTGAHGGAIAAIGATHFICNNTFVSDSATYGGAISSQGAGSAMKAVNNIFSENYATGTSVDTNINTAGTYLFANNMYTGSTPLFVNAANPIGADGIWATADDGLMLQHCSPAVNAGNNIYLSSVVTDITGNHRILGDTVDMGAYETTTIGIITGMDTTCVGTVVTYADTTLGGTWSSSNPAVIIINATTGVAATIASGTATISYQHASSCGTDIATFAVTVLSSPGTATISGPATVCAGSQITLTSSLPGGIWNNVIGNATVSSVGVVTGITPGVDTITYTISNICGSSVSSQVMTVSDLPATATITGPNTICEGYQLTLTSSLTGGIWGNAFSYVSVNSSGVVSGIFPGVDTITYTLSNACGSAVAKHTITVYSTAQCDSVASVGSVTGSGYALSIAPNPAHGSVTISLTSANTEEATIVMTNAIGVIVKQWIITTNKKNELVLDVPAGIYMITVANNNIRYNSKIVID